MSDDEADPELLALLRQHLGMGPRSSTAPPETRVLDNARFIYDNSIDVALDMRSTQAAAEVIWKQMKQREYSTSTWSEHELHPKTRDESTLNFIFTMDLLNFCFWSESGPGYKVEWRYKLWDGYWSMVAALQRALHEGIPITDPSFWIKRKEPEKPVIKNEPMDVVEESVGQEDSTEVEDANAAAKTVEEASAELEELAENVEDLSTDDNSNKVSVDDDARPLEEEVIPQGVEGDAEVATAPVLDLDMMRHIFRSVNGIEMPLLQERLDNLREAGEILHKDFNGSVADMISKANHSAAGLVNLLADHFACFRDEARFEGKRVRFLKRAQIFVADVWAAFGGESHGAFDDIDKITMFADYRIPQALARLGCIWYSPPLESQIKNLREIQPGHSWEVQIRGCSIWSIELIRREIVSKHPEAKVNAILIDFFLYDTIKELEKASEEMLPHHRTRTVWY